MSFMSLPRELRDQIYQLVLVASEPILVYSQFSTPWPHNMGYLSRHKRKNLEEDRVLHSLTLGLLTASRDVAAESSVTFYSQNTFQFIGWRLWDPLCVFIGMLGQKKYLLRTVSMYLSDPGVIGPQVWRKRSTLGPWPFRRIQMLDEEFQQLLNRFCQSYADGEVDYIDPAVQTFFKLLGKGHGRLTIYMHPGGYALPGVILCREDPNFPPDDLPMPWPESTATADVLEVLRKRYSAMEGHTEGVKILWKAECSTPLLTARMEDIESAGWNILDVGEHQPADGAHWVKTTFTVQRKPEMYSDV